MGFGCRALGWQEKEAEIDVRKLVGLFLVDALCSVYAPAVAQSAGVQSARSSVTIVQPFRIRKNSDLEFGTIVHPTSPASNTVTIDPATGLRALTGGGNAVLVPSTASRAAFTVTGAGGQAFSLTVPMTVTMTSGADTMTVTLTSNGSSGVFSGAIGTTGTATIGIGGSISVSNNQASGTYSGSFNTTIAYN